MITKSIVSISFLLLLSTCFLQCDKKIAEAVHTEEFVEEAVTPERTDRNDIPPPPSEPWWTVDPDQLTRCQRALWSGLSKLYPIEDDMNPEYQIYTIQPQATVEYSVDNVIASHARFFNERFPENYLYNGEYSCPEELGQDFFRAALGEPTCISHGYHSNKTTFFYYLKLRFRYGPCPHTRYEGREIGAYCDSTQVYYCAKLRATFSETGELEYINFAIW